MSGEWTYLGPKEAPKSPKESASRARKGPGAHLVGIARSLVVKKPGGGEITIDTTLCSWCTETAVCSVHHAEAEKIRNPGPEMREVVLSVVFRPARGKSLLNTEAALRRVIEALSYVDEVNILTSKKAKS